MDVVLTTWILWNPIVFEKWLLMNTLSSLDYKRLRLLELQMWLRKISERRSRGWKKSGESAVPRAETAPSPGLVSRCVPLICSETSQTCHIWESVPRSHPSPFQFGGVKTVNLSYNMGGRGGRHELTGLQMKGVTSGLREHHSQVLEFQWDVVTRQNPGEAMCSLYVQEKGWIKWVMAQGTAEYIIAE